MPNGSFTLDNGQLIVTIAMIDILSGGTVSELIILDRGWASSGNENFLVYPKSMVTITIKRNACPLPL